MSRLLTVALVGLFSISARPAFAQMLEPLLIASSTAQALPPHAVISEDTSDQRRSVYVRLVRRLDETDLSKIASAIKARSKRTYARTHINFFLPDMVLNQGAWASVLFAPEPKLLINGLRREDEDLFLAEHQVDRRSMLGSWMTSPPAAPGRLTIYSDHGRIFSEWRLRSGLKTVEELRESHAGKGRRFDVVDGGSFVLTKSGDLEIWDKTTLVAVGERLRAEPVSSVATAMARKEPSGSVRTPATVNPVQAAPLVATPAAPVLAEPNVAAKIVVPSIKTETSPSALGGPIPSTVAAPTIAANSAPQIAAASAEPVGPSEIKAKGKAKANRPTKSRERVVEKQAEKPRQVQRQANQNESRKSSDSRKVKEITTGDRIAAQISGR
jgi:hypothetical protein